MKKFFFILLLLSLLTNISFGLIKYIKPSSFGIGDGSSWANASSDLQLMINSSNAGDTIWVAAGTYIPIRPSNQTNIIDLKNRNNAFVLKPNINIFGGFLGNEATNFNLSNRDFTNNQSILSGDFNLNDVYDSSTDTIITGNSENAFRVLMSTGNIGSVKIDGLTCKGGNGDNGGGLYLTSSSPNFFNCKFLGNQAGAGGGIWLGGSNSTFTNCLIKGNKSTFGAGIYTTVSTIGFIKCTIETNVAIRFTNNYGNAFGAGIITYSSNISITDCSFNNNYANYGAAIANFQSTLNISKTRFIENKATDGGGAIRSDGGVEKYINCRFEYNTSKVGGALMPTNPNQNFVNTTFLSNSATKDGGVVYNVFQDDYSITKINQIFTNCTFDLNNAVGSGKIIYAFGYNYNFDNTVKFNNSIIWLSRFLLYNGNDLLSGSSINGYNAKYSLNNSILQGSITNNITLNTSSQSLLNIYPSLTHSYFPEDNSVAINTGDNSLYTSAGGNLQTDKDFFGFPRLINANIDIGAFENQTSTFTAAPTITYFTPISAKPGDAVTLIGTGFNTTTTNNIVFFGATKATITAATATSVTVTVPIGATYAPITLLNTSTSLSAYSRSNFIPTYSPAKTSLKATDFAANIDFASGTYPLSVAIGDLDGDGKPDLAVANYLSKSISVYRNTSTSGSITSTSFAAKVDYTTGDSPRSVAISDLDGDGKPDLAVTNQGSNTISIFRNTSTSGSIGAGSFETKVDFTTGIIPISLAIGDLNSDGKPDLAIANATSNSVSIIRNTSTSGNINLGSFAPKQDFTTGTTPHSVVIGDLDGDGKPDLVVANSNSANVSLFQNSSSNGSISFANKVDFTTGLIPFSVAIGDLDGDGKPDLAVANRDSDNLSLFQNTSIIGSINTNSFTAKVDFTAGNSPYSVAIADLDGDGKLDLAVANFFRNTVSTYRNSSTSGSISTSSFSTKVDYQSTLEQGFSYLAIGDLDGDGKPDMVITQSNRDIISVFRNTSNNADLAGLAISSGTLTPAFATGITSYTASVSSATTSITVTPTRAVANSTITVNGVAVTSGSASGSIALNVGSNTITIMVTAQDGTTKTYTLTVTKAAASSNADLANLTISSGTLTPTFAAGTTAYTASVTNATTSITVTPTRAEANATITINGVAVTSGSASSAIPLNVGSNTITTIVTAQDGTTIKTYTITVSRAAASSNADLVNLTLSSGTLSPAFAAGTTTYTASVSNAASSITVTPTSADANATITVNGIVVASRSASGAIALNVGGNTITTIITAQDGTTTKIYTITVTRAAASDNADLASLAISSGTLTPTFAAGTISYTASVSNATTSITVTPTKAEANATITVNGVAVTNGSASGAILLNVGNNTITTVVTAQNGTTKTYVVTLSRANNTQCTPPTGGSITAPTNGCSDRVATVSVTGVSNPTIYIWSIVGASFTKVSDSEYNIVYGSANVTITVTPANGTNGSCTGTLLTKTIIVSAAPSKPTISQTGTVLSANSSSPTPIFQWYLGSNMIIGATASTYSPTQSGAYSVESKNTNGCVTFSDPFTYFTTAIKEDAKFTAFNFYPNPVESILFTVFTEKYDLEFFDTSGRKVLENKNLNGESQTDLSPFNKGIYIMKVTSGGKIATRKIILK